MKRMEFGGQVPPGTLGWLYRRRVAAWITVAVAIVGLGWIKQIGFMAGLDNVVGWSILGLWFLISLGVLGLFVTLIMAERWVQRNNP